MKTTRATEGALGVLHDLVAKDLTRRILSGEATPAELNAAIKFLQNNGIEAIPVEGSPLSALMGSLPTFDDDDVDETLTH